MATLSGNSPSSPASTQGTGRNNKRKLEYYPPTYEQYLQLKYGFLNRHAQICDICRSFTCGSRDEPQLDYAYDFKLNLTETQVEDMISAHLDVIYRNVIKDLTFDYGYPEADATCAVLATGICYGCKDPIGNALNHALTFLMCGLRVDKPKRQNFAEELKTLVKFVSMIIYDGQKKKHSYLCKDDFLPWLLIYEMDLLDVSTLASYQSDSLENVTGLQWKEESTSNSSTGQFMPKAGVTEDDKLDASSPHLENDSEPELTPATGILGLAFGRFAAATSLSLSNSDLNTAKMNPMLSYDSLFDKFSTLTISESSILEEKPAYANSEHSDTSKRGFTQRRMERRCQTRLIGKARKLVTLTNQILESSRRTMLDSKFSLPKLEKIVGLESSQSFAAKNFSFDAGSFATSSFSMNIVNTTLSLSHAANANAFIIVPSKSNSDASFIPDYSVASIPYVMEKFLPHGKDLQVQLQYWTNWAHHKVMQTTNRLNIDMAELQTLRQEKLEATKEEAFADGTMKKIREMDTSLSRARTQVEVASAAIIKLEFEKTKLEQELKAAKLCASESAANSQEASLKEIVTHKKAQTCERERTLFQEELVTEKRMLSQLQKQLQQAQVPHGQLEVITSNFIVCYLFFSKKYFQVCYYLYIYLFSDTICSLNYVCSTFDINALNPLHVEFTIFRTKE